MLDSFMNYAHEVLCVIVLTIENLLLYHITLYYSRLFIIFPIYYY